MKLSIFSGVRETGFKTRAYIAAQASPKSMIFLFSLFHCWNYRSKLPQLAEDFSINSINKPIKLNKILN